MPISRNCTTSSTPWIPYPQSSFVALQSFRQSRISWIDLTEFVFWRDFRHTYFLMLSHCLYFIKNCDFKRIILNSNNFMACLTCLSYFSEFGTTGTKLFLRIFKFSFLSRADHFDWYWFFAIFSHYWFSNYKFNYPSLRFTVYWVLFDWNNKQQYGVTINFKENLDCLYKSHTISPFGHNTNSSGFKAMQIGFFLEGRGSFD